MSFETYECSNCGESYTAYEDAQAAQTTYCSPDCETEGRELDRDWNSSPRDFTA